MQKFVKVLLLGTVLTGVFAIMMVRAEDTLPEGYSHRVIDAEEGRGALYYGNKNIGLTKIENGKIVAIDAWTGTYVPVQDGQLNRALTNLTAGHDAAQSLRQNTTSFDTLENEFNEALGGISSSDWFKNEANTLDVNMYNNEIGRHIPARSDEAKNDALAADLSTLFMEGEYDTLRTRLQDAPESEKFMNLIDTAEGVDNTPRESLSMNPVTGDFTIEQENGTKQEYNIDSDGNIRAYDENGNTTGPVLASINDTSYTTPKTELKSTSLTEDNVNILGFDNVFGERSIWKADASKQPTLNSDGTITITSAQTDQLHNAFGVWVNSSGNVVSDGTALGQATVTAMQSAKTFQTDLKNLQSASAAVSTAETNVRIAQADLDRSPNSESAKKALTEAKQELSDAQANQTAAEVPVNQHIQNLENVKTEARNSLNDTLNSYHEVGPNAEGFEYNAFKVGLNNDLDAGNYNAANGRIDQALKDGLITEDQANTLKNKVAGIETADGNLNEAKEAKNESTNTQVSIREVNAVDVARIVLEVLAVTEAENDLSIQEDINIKAGEIGEAVGAVDETVLATDTGEDASSASTIVNAAATVKSLLQAAVVDLGLLSEDVSTSEGDTAISSDIGGLAVMESQTGNLSEVTTNNDNGGNDNTTDPVVEAKRKVIEQRREDLMGQYAAAAIQVAEGMNAISNKFFDRANVLVSFSTNIQTESAAFGLAQDTGRYVLLEALRNVALSSIQMGVQATRLLNEQTVEVSSDDN